PDPLCRLGNARLGARWRSVAHQAQARRLGELRRALWQYSVVYVGVFMAHSVYAALQQTVQQWPDNDFLLVLPETAEIFDIEAGHISYQQAFDQVEALAAAYQQAGYGHGHRVGILLENRPAFLLHWLALNKLGVSIVPINPDLRIAELEYLIGHSEMCLIVALPSRHADLRAAAEAAGHQVVISAPEQTPPAALTPDPLTDAIYTDTECALMYTSGTTGLPKGCILP